MFDESEDVSQMIGQIPKSPANPFFRMRGCDFENPDVVRRDPGV
jgi:hypothetical protein